MSTGEKQLFFLFFSIGIVRFFTETYPVLPHVLQFADFLLLPVFIIVFLWRMAWLGQLPHHGGSWFLFSMIFAVVCGLSVIANRSDIYWAAALLFITGHLSPIIYAYILMNWPMKERAFGRRFVNAMMIFGLVQIVAGMIELPRYFAQIESGIESDALSGTYGYNADELAVVLCLPVLLLFERRIAGVRRFRELVMFIVLLAMVYFASMKTLWVFFPLMLLALMVVFSRREVIRRVALVVVCCAAAFFAVTKLEPSWIRSFSYLSQPDVILKQGKVLALMRVPTVMTQRPWGVLIGVGPGTFSSRGFRTFAKIDEGDVEGNEAIVSPTASFRRPYLPPITREYLVLPRRDDASFGVFGSIKTAGPFTSYASLPIESGLLGTAAIFAIYFLTFFRLRKIYRRALAARDAELRGLAFAAAGGLMLLAGMAILDNYFELTRVTIAVWMFVVAAFVRARALAPAVVKSIPARVEATVVGADPKVA